MFRSSLIAIGSLVLAVSLGGWFWLRTSLPPEHTVVEADGISAPVSIARDSFGIPTIEAASDRDAAFALGFVHAQDRLFQMDLMRRFGAGRLSEWFGRKSLDSDRFARALGFYRAAEAQYKNLSEPTRSILDAYSRGVNAFIASHAGALPPEYYALNARWEEWVPADTLVWGKIIDLELTGNFRDELLRVHLLQQVPSDQLSVLFPPYVEAGALEPDRRATIDGIPVAPVYASLPNRTGAYEASNNWVLSGAHTSSGAPLLANDPHLSLSAPSTWYLARIKTPNETRVGASAAGTPFILIGYNEHVAWGVTATRSDVEDLYAEEIDSSDPGRYVTPDGSVPFDRRTELIHVKGAEPISQTVRLTRHGPVISDLGGANATDVPAGRVLSLKTTWLSDDDLSPDAMWQMSFSRDWTEFAGALEKLTAPQLNFVYADVTGNIGFLAPGRIPIRRKGDGWLPAPGWTADYDWVGFVPYSELPRSFNPELGRIVTANNKIVSEKYPHFLAKDWIAPYRAARIDELLKEPRKYTVQDMEAIQLDTVSLSARQLLPLLLETPANHRETNEMLARLKSWDLRMSPDGVEPLIFMAWLRELSGRLLQPRLGPAFVEYQRFRPEVIYFILKTRTDWCDDPTTTEVETCQTQLSRSIEAAYHGLSESFGSNIEEWRWGRVHKAEFVNQLWSRVPILDRLTAVELPAGGGSDTINNSTVAFRNERTPFHSYFGSTLRMVVDLSEPIRGHFMIAPGQSGNPLSPNYKDLLSLWDEGKMVEIGDSTVGGVTKLVPHRS